MKKNNYFFITLAGILISLFLVTFPVSAQIATQPTISAFHLVKDISVPFDLKVPTILEFPVRQSELTTQPFALYEVTTGSFVSYLLLENFQEPVQSIKQSGVDIPSLHDSNYTTYHEFSSQGTATVTVLTIDSIKPISSNQLQIQLDTYARTPTSVSIYTGVEAQQLVVADQLLTNSAIYFPETESSRWQIEIKHTQPLRITEMKFMPLQTSLDTDYTIRFLAQPSYQYRLYLQPNPGVISPEVAYVDLGNVTEGTRTVSASPAYTNPGYIEGDQDNDGIADVTDNCPAYSNADQVDVDTNGTGDACEDFDHDNVMNSVDNCINKPNINQADADGDKYGDVCDPEESRLTERFWWLPWLGIAIGFGVVAFIFMTTVRPEKKETDKRV